MGLKIVCDICGATVTEETKIGVVVDLLKKREVNQKFVCNNCRNLSGNITAIIKRNTVDVAITKLTSILEASKLQKEDYVEEEIKKEALK